MLNGKALLYKYNFIKKQQFIHNVNDDGSKNVKIIKGAITHITMTFRRHDGG